MIISAQLYGNVKMFLVLKTFFFIATTVTQMDILVLYLKVSLSNS